MPVDREKRGTSIPLRDMPKALRKAGRRAPHKATIYRLAQRGKYGVLLETWYEGGRRCSSLEAMDRFDEAVGKAMELPRVPIIADTPDLTEEQVMESWN
ncbi:MAG: DUF1580 domain-containing protein [Aureliella sp.]